MRNGKRVSYFKPFFSFLRKDAIITPKFKNSFILGWSVRIFKCSNFTNMKKIVVLFFVLSIFGCSSLRNTQKVAVSEEKGKHILPPNTASNKYSKIRQGGN